MTETLKVPSVDPSHCHCPPVRDVMEDGVSPSSEESVSGTQPARTGSTGGNYALNWVADEVYTSASLPPPPAVSVESRGESKTLSNAQTAFLAALAPAPPLASLGC